MRIAIFILALCCLGPARVLAADDEPNEQQKTKAAQYFQRGELLFSNGDFANAAKAFELAYEISPHPTVLANIALSYDKAGQLVKAVATYRKYLLDAERNAANRKMRNRLAELEGKIGELLITCSVEPCQIQVNGMPYAGSSPSVLVPPGSYRVEATAEDMPKTAIEVSVTAGESSRVRLIFEAREDEIEEPAPIPIEPEPALHTETDEPGPKLGIPFWVATGMTGASGVVTLVFGIRTLNHNQEFEASGQTDQSLADLGKRDRLITNIMAGVTIASALTATGFLVYDLFFKKRSKDKEDVAIMIGPGAGVMVGGRF